MSVHASLLKTFGSQTDAEYRYSKKEHDLLGQLYERMEYAARHGKDKDHVESANASATTALKAIVKTLAQLHAEGKSDMRTKEELPVPQLSKSESGALPRTEFHRAISDCISGIGKLAKPSRRAAQPNATWFKLDPETKVEKIYEAVAPLTRILNQYQGFVALTFGIGQSGRSSEYGRIGDGYGAAMMQAIQRVSSVNLSGLPSEGEYAIRGRIVSEGSSLVQ